MSRDLELQKRGWKRQFVADEPRLSEALEEYQKLGFEVHLEPVDPEGTTEECTECLGAARERYKIIYTRPRNE
jgi:hypothetical protein